MSDYDDLEIRPNSQTFDRPWDTLELQDTFGDREVGISHPDANSFVRIRGNGDVELVSGGSVSMVLSGRLGTVTIVADKVKFITSHEQGLRWNDLYFNEKAHHYNDPTFIDVDDMHDGFNVYEGVDYYLEGDEVEEEIVEGIGSAADLIRSAISEVPKG